MNVDGLIVLLNKAGLELAAYEQEIARLREENQALRAALTEAADGKSAPSGE